MVIIAVLGVLTVLMVMNMQLSSDTMYTATYFASMQTRESGYYLSLSAAKSCMMLLSMESQLDPSKNKNAPDTLNDMWARPVPLIKVGDTVISIEIEDLERYIALNSIVDDEAHLNVFRRLLSNNDINPDYANSVVDWLDADDNTTMPGGSETPALSSLRYVKNAPMDSADELFLIEHFVKRDDNQDLPAIKNIFPNLVAAHSGKININTAGLEVLKSLDEEMNDKMAQEIIDRRKDNPITDIKKDLLDIPGFSDPPAALARIDQVAGINSTYFRIKIDTIRGDETNRSVLVVKRDGTSVSVISWKVE